MAEELKEMCHDELEQIRELTTCIGFQLRRRKIEKDI
jgi:hypothetical protein